MDRTYPVGSGLVRWVDGAWLQAHLAEKELQIIDCQPNVHDYIKEHIPGALYLNEGLLRAHILGLPAAYVPAAAIEPVLRGAGLEAHRPVVVTTGAGAVKGWGDGLEQTMWAYSLTRFGHDRVYILDGGLEKWKAEGRPLEQAFAQTRESKFKVQVRRELFVTYEEFKAVKDRPDVLLLDARPEEVYAGQGPWRKAGHIPGAVNLPWASLMNDANRRLLKPDAEIRAILEERRIGPDRNIICSCGTGREATNEFLLFKWYLNYPQVKIYEGSFSEWTAFDENPTVTGPSPR